MGGAGCGCDHGWYGAPDRPGQIPTGVVLDRVRAPAWAAHGSALAPISPDPRSALAPDGLERPRQAGAVAPVPPRLADGQVATAWGGAAATTRPAGAAATSCPNVTPGHVKAGSGGRSRRVGRARPAIKGRPEHGCDVPASPRGPSEAGRPGLACPPVRSDQVARPRCRAPAGRSPRRTAGRRPAEPMDGAPGRGYDRRSRTAEEARATGGPDGHGRGSLRSLVLGRGPAGQPVRPPGPGPGATPRPGGRRRSRGGSAGGPGPDRRRHRRLGAGPDRQPHRLEGRHRPHPHRLAHRRVSRSLLPGEGPPWLVQPAGRYGRGRPRHRPRHAE